MLLKGDAGCLQYPLLELILQVCIFYLLIFFCDLIEKQHLFPQIDKSVLGYAEN